jgi:hypothetical protein
LISYVYDHGALAPSDLYLATSVDQSQNSGFVMLEDDQGQRPTETDQFRLSLAVEGSGEETTAVVAWADRRNSVDEIWSQRLLLDGVPPSAPANLTATPAERAVILRWTAAEDAAGIAGYRIDRATDAAGLFDELTARLVTATEYVDVELDPVIYPSSREGNSHFQK